MLKFIFKTFLLLLLVSQALGQAIETDTIPKGKMWIPTHVRVGTDIVSIGKSGLSDFTEQWEVQTEIDLFHYYLVFDVGHQNYRVKQDPNSRTQFLQYSSDGYYWRLGMDANLISYDKYGGILSIGLRYARTNHRDVMGGVKIVDGWGTTPFFNINESASTSWIEIVTGLKARIWKGFTMGYTLRLKFNSNTKGADQIESYWIPGYGLGDRSNNWGVSYYVYWTIPFRQKYLPPRKR